MIWSVALCTTCKGRLEHLRKTLPENLRACRGYTLDPVLAKCVVVTYGDQEAADYLKITHRGDIDSGRLVVFHYPVDGPFNVAHAKNLAARLGIEEGADILVTMDADNWAPEGFLASVAGMFSEKSVFACPDFEHIRSLPHGPLRPFRGYAGRLAIRSQDFIKSGGYDEVYSVWGGEDIDMIERMKRMGYFPRTIPNEFLKVIPHNAEVRFREYPHARQNESPREWARIHSRTETVVNNGRFGIGEVARNFSPDLIRLERVPTRVFGVGLQKTATTSLDRAFGILGLDHLHWGTGEAPRVWREMTSTGRSSTLEKFYALSDLPIPLLYQELDRGYPGSKFILTIRDEGKWLSSVEKLWDYRFNPTRWIWEVFPFSHHIHTVLYGRRTFDREIFLARYRRHNSDVREYFRDRPEDLLVMDMDAGAGWEELCGFLKVSVPAVGYPRGNPTHPTGPTQPTGAAWGGAEEYVNVRKEEEEK